MRPVRFATCPPPSSRAAAPASAPFVCSAPRARGGARPCGGTGAAARPARRAGGKQCRARAGEALPFPRCDKRGPGQPLTPASRGSGARRAAVLFPWAAASMHPAPTGAIMGGGGTWLISLYPAVKPAFS